MGGDVWGILQSAGFYSGIISLSSSRYADFAGLLKLGGLVQALSFIAQQAFILSFAAGAINIGLQCTGSTLALVGMMAAHMALYAISAAFLFLGAFFAVVTPVIVFGALFAGAIYTALVTILEDYLMEHWCS